MKELPTLRFCRVREVKAPTRANQGDAGLDFYFPNDLTLQELVDKQPSGLNNALLYYRDTDGTPCHRPYDSVDTVRMIGITPHSRVLIPSGIRVLITPRNSMLMAANKSGVCTKTGLIFGAEIVDSPYTGEIHISLINTSNSTVWIKAGEKLVQFIHVPVYQTELEEIPEDLYDKIAEDWGTRGSGGFGSSDNYDDELNIRAAQL